MSLTADQIGFRYLWASHPMTHTRLQNVTVVCQYSGFLYVQNPKGKDHTVTLILRILCGREYRHIFNLYKSPDKTIQTVPDYFWFQ